MTKATFNKILVKYQKAGITVKIEKEEFLSHNYHQWNLRFQNGIRVVRVIIGHNIANDEISCRLKSGNKANIYDIGKLLGLKFVVEI